MPPTVAIVDDHRAVAEAFAAAINVRSAAAATAVAADEVLAARPDLVLLDLPLVDRSSAEVVAPLAARGLRVAVLTAAPAAPDADAARSAGAVAVLDKASSLDEILGAVDELLGLDERPSVLDALTSTERRVLADLVDGRSAARIAADRGVALTTVRSQVRAVLTKLGVNSQLEAVAVARREGLGSD